MRTGIRSVVAIGLAALGCTSLSAHSQTRSVFEDFTTQMSGSDHQASLGPDLFGDRTDLYSGATSFLVTDVSLPGNSDLPVALQRSLNAADTGLDCFGPQCGPDAFMAWTRFEVPYLSGGYPEGWVAATQSLGHIASTQRCSLTNGPPEIPDDKGLYGEWMVYEYWHGNHLYLPGAGSQQLLVGAGGSPPTDGQTYRWVTKDHWYFSCLPTTANGQPGEGFLARAPDGKKYYFDYLVNWRPASLLRKFDDEQDEMVLTRDEYRLLLTRVEDRFGNWVQYAYSGKDLTSITANDGRQLTMTYASPGGALTSVSDGTRTWTYNYTNGVRVTFPDSTVWHATLSGPGILRNTPTGCGEYANVYTGEATVTITHRSGAVGTFLFRPLRRGLSHVFYQWQLPDFCPSIPKYYDNIALYSKSISGAGFQAANWSYVYGPANACHAAGAGETTGPCTAASPTTRYVEVSGPGTFTRYTFGNKWEDTDGALFRIETGSSPSLILLDEALTWQTFQAPGSLGNSAGGNLLSTIVRTVATRTITQGGATYATTNSNWDVYFKPQTVMESGPNGGSRTTQTTYHNDRAKWVIGQVATSTSPGRSLSRTFNANALVASVTEDGVTTSYTSHADGTLATTTTPRFHVHSFSNYKRGIPQSESHPEAVNITRVVNNHGFVTSQTDGENRTTNYGHDAVGRVTSIDRPIGNDVSIVYSGATKSTKTTTRGGLVQTVSYDALWRPTTVVWGGITMTYQYDAFGRLTFQSNPNDSIGTTTEYDALGRITKVTHPDSNYRSFTYGAATVTERDERANLTTRTLRAYGDPDDALLMSIAAPVSAANMSLTRDSNSLIRSVTQAGLTRNLDYDTRNYLISETHPETGTTTFERDAAGNMTARIIGGARTEFGYDGLNRLTTTNFPDTTPDITQTWSKTSQLKTVSSADAARTLGYDDNDNLTSESLASGATTLSATYGYNGNDQLASITYPVSLRVVSYAPNALGRPTQVSGYAAAVTYWPSGQMRQIDYANGTVSTYEQNSRLWPSAFYTRRGSFYSMSSTYGYDGAGNMTSIVDAVDGALSRTLGYDGIDRLTSATGPWGSGTIGYDGAGNITSQSLGSFSLSYTYNGQNRLASVSGSRSASYGYDAAGNVTSAGGATYNYDAVPNMRCANCGAGSRTDYTYDGARSRVKVVKSGVTTYEFHAANGDLLVEYTPSQANRLIEYIYLDGKRIAQRVSDQSAPTSITAIATTVTANLSGSVVIGVNVGGASPSGTVAFAKQGTVLGTAHVLTGSASVEVTGLGGGLHTLTATYSGDATNSGNSRTFDLTVIIPPPGVPSSISVPATNTTGTYKVSWGSAAGSVDYYQLYYATNAAFTGQGLAYQGTGLTVTLSRSDGTYYYRVRACNVSGCSGYRPGANPVVVTQAPHPPDNIGVPTSSYTGSYSIIWSTYVGTVTAYELYEATNASFSGQSLVYTGTGTSAALSGRGNGTYYYRVRTCNTVGCSSYREGMNALTVLLAPGAPSSISVPSISSSGSYTVSWGAGSGVISSYEVYEANNSSFSGEGLIYNGGGTSVALSGRANGSYYYRVRACNASGCSAFVAGTNGVTVSRVQAAVSSTSWSWRRMPNGNTIVSPNVVVTATGGSGTGYTYAWQYVSGDTQISVVNPSSNSARWSRTMPNSNVTFTAVWRCLVTDSAGGTVYSPSVTVTFTRHTNQ